MLDKPGVLSDLRENGFAMLPPLSADQVADIRDWLLSRQVYPGCHVRKGAGAPGSYADMSAQEVLSFHHLDVIRAPHMLEYALQLTDIAAEWLGCEPPFLYSANCFITRPGTYRRPDINDWHTDSDDLRFLPLFIYLTDVGDDGAQELQGPKGTQRITGKAGTAFFSDTSRTHRGLKPQKERMVCWWRWGVSEDPAQAVADKKIPWHAYVGDGLVPLKKYKLGDRYPSDPRLRESIKLLVA